MEDDATLPNDIASQEKHPLVFARGWQCGVIWERFCAAARRHEVQTFWGTYHKEHVEQLSAMAKLHGYQMRHRDAQPKDGTNPNFVYLVFSNDPDWIAQRPEQDRDL